MKDSAGQIYNMRHLENLYYKDFHEIAFSTVSEKTGKELDVRPQLFAPLMGSSITELDFYTNAGVYHISCDVYVPKYLSVTYTDGLPEEELFADRIMNAWEGDATPAYDGAEPARDGYVFRGWNPEVSAAVTGSTVYTAVWAAADDVAAADAVRAMIEALKTNAGTADAEAVAQARAAYNALTDAQKALVDSEVLSRLEKAETSVAQAKAAEQEARRLAEEKAKAEKAREEKAKAQAAFGLNVKNGAKNVPLQLKKNNKKIKVTSLMSGDSVKSVVSSNKKAVSAKLSGKTIVLKGLKNKAKATITVTTKKGASVKFTVKVQKGKVKTKKITTVSKKGVIKARKAGKVKITVKSGSKRKVVTVTVKKK